MPHRQCKVCRQVVPASEFRAHRERHRHDRRERPGTTAKWRRLRQLILARDGNLCVLCGSSEELEVDHIDGDWRNDDPRNLRTVCFDCNPRGRNQARHVGGIS
jgi:5-methylcytosine-specific restriction endonuclease McrA